MRVTTTPHDEDEGTPLAIGLGVLCVIAAWCAGSCRFFGATVALVGCVALFVVASIPR